MGNQYLSTQPGQPNTPEQQQNARDNADVYSKSEVDDGLALKPDIASLGTMSTQNASAVAITGGTMSGVVEKYTPVVLAIVSGVVTVDCTVGQNHKTLALSANVTSWVFTNRPTGTDIIKVLVVITQDAAAAKTCVTPASADSTAGGTWVVSTALGAVEVLELWIGASTVQLFPSGVYV